MSKPTRTNNHKNKSVSDITNSFNSIVKDLTENNIICFVEGKDDRHFYYDFVKEEFSDYNIIFVEAILEKTKGRSSVIEECKRINKKSIAAGKLINQVLFFIDKDFHIIQPEQPENLFTTKYHSIENYLVNEEVFALLLRYYFNYDDNTITEKKEKFVTLLQNFAKKLLLFNAYLFLDTNNEKLKKDNNHLFNHYLQIIDNDSFSINTNFELKEQDKVDIEYLQNLTSNDKKTKITKKEYSDEKIKEIKNEYSQELIDNQIKNIVNNYKIYMRGKTELDFLISVFKDIGKNINKSVSFISLFYTKAILQKKLVIPKELSDFLQNNSNKLKKQ